MQKKWICIVVATLSDNSFFFSAMQCVGVGIYIRIFMVLTGASRVHPIYCDIFCPAERVRYMACRLTSDISTKMFHHLYAGISKRYLEFFGWIQFIWKRSNSIPVIVFPAIKFASRQNSVNFQHKLPCDKIVQIVCKTTSAGTFLWIYRRLIGRPYIALAQQDKIYRNISDALGRLRSDQQEEAELIWGECNHAAFLER